ncbi:MAG: uL22 family ribosomal protein [Nanoarchaeota archaeon]|nr:uL22 family ribosomal protein [Nanoarchaeota archaeon]
MAEENKETKLEEKTEETKTTEKEEKVEEKKTETAEKTKEKKKEEVKKVVKVKKTEAVVNAKSLPISTLDAMYISKFIKKKTIEKAIENLEMVLKFKKAIPMRGEIPHRKGKRMMSGRYPLKAVESFIILLKSLQSNANANGMDEPIVVEAIANKAYQPFGRFGAIRRKRTHITIKVMEKKLISKKKTKK